MRCASVKRNFYGLSSIKFALRNKTARGDAKTSQSLCDVARGRRVLPHQQNKTGDELIPGVWTNSAVKSFHLFLAALFFVTSFPAAGQDKTANSAAKTGTWSGILVSSACNADEAFAESPECMKDVPGAQLALYDDTNRVMYGLEPQEKIAAHLGDTVTVRGTLEEDAIRVASVELMSIGLAVGQKAPAFLTRDQFGRLQTLETLRGANGTVLLFFRSADW
jgi:hypothetical protein